MAQAHRSEQSDLYREFKQLVNMPPKRLEGWLRTPESNSVGWINEGESESVGHHSGEKILGIKHKKKAELTDEDYQHMSKVVGYIKRHLAQKPDGDVTETRWRYSLMNWGHDPLKSH